jgi:hypothetical protein
MTMACQEELVCEGLFTKSDIFVESDTTPYALRNKFTDYVMSHKNMIDPSFVMQHDILS